MFLPKIETKKLEQITNTKYENLSLNLERNIVNDNKDNYEESSLEIQNTISSIESIIKINDLNNNIITPTEIIEEIPSIENKLIQKKE